MKAHNGRPVEIDAKQGALDAAVYVRQGVVEGNPWGKAYELALRTVVELYAPEEKRPDPPPACFTCLPVTSQRGTPESRVCATCGRDVAP